MSGWFGFRAPTLTFLYRWAIANLAANVLLVVTGGAVRLTGSGLGCPTWPQCGGGKYTPPLSYHGVIEFGNRTLTFVLAVIAIATWVAAMRYRPVDRTARRLATVVALGIPLQAVIGGVTVLTNLNPWVVSLHFLATIGIISLATWLVFRTRPEPLDRGDATTVPARLAVALAWTVYAVTWVTIYLGTVVTGAGPHAGDEKAHRNSLDPANASQLHADAVWTLVGAAFALILLAVIAGLAMKRAALIFGGIVLLQGLIGYIQYATHLPMVLVILHMFGASLLMIGASWLLFSARGAARTIELTD
ncbi:MAG: COX15/CtaA family protein [Gordonia sp. (in: high G+C Gram-positive bacteria)]|uniref:COX15/CtaA family protein n=1 Tax=Gordonia sp. (in: high G+C Gram-positive bacteria) TaxID=84139 RepID=UPI0039E6C0FE